MTNYRVFRDSSKDAVLETNDLDRAHRAMDSMFEDASTSSYDRPREVKILNSFDQIIELRRADKAVRLIPGGVLNCPDTRNSLPKIGPRIALYLVLLIIFGRAVIWPFVNKEPLANGIISTPFSAKIQPPSQSEYVRIFDIAESKNIRLTAAKRFRYFVVKASDAFLSSVYGRVNFRSFGLARFDHLGYPIKAIPTSNKFRVGWPNAYFTGTGMNECVGSPIVGHNGCYVRILLAKFILKGTEFDRQPRSLLAGKGVHLQPYHLESF